MTQLEILILALLLDAIIGDPDRVFSRIPHPAALMGRLLGFLENLLNKGRLKRWKGSAALVLMIVIVAAVACTVQWLPLSELFELILITMLLAQNSLSRHVTAVATGLATGLGQGRRAVGMIVGRDPQALDASGVARSAIESSSENFSDGIIAPAFWALLFGLPGIMIYKMVNTADSMIGYKTERYQEFGWASARLDDVLNFIPARLSGLLICISHLSTRAYKIMRRDAALHRSPNAGWPEAAVAGVLNIAISGPRSYAGNMEDHPFVNPDGRHELIANDIRAAVRVNWRSWGVFLALLIGAEIIWACGA